MVWNKKLLGKILRDGVMKEGLIDTLKPAVEAVQPELKKAQTVARQQLNEAGWSHCPDPAEAPREALRFQLNEIVRHLLQTPKSQAYYVLGELTGLVTLLLSAHPKLGGLLGLAQVMGLKVPGRRSGDRAAAISLNALLGNGRVARTMAEGGQALFSGNRAYEAAQQHARGYQQLNPLQQQVIDQCALIASMLAEESTATADIQAKCAILSQIVTSERQELLEGLLPEHQQGIREVLDQGLTAIS
ncbi:hypothetical protein [Ferrimonas pelagia]|uniref:Uncharacterized protein n=1 Tax=Ferrimonas pelagia TaxID=1177826 RepID=A0ABP9FK88_9GAMM